MDALDHALPFAFRLAHRVSIAFLAISRRRSGDSASLRALPPTLANFLLRNRRASANVKSFWRRFDLLFPAFLRAFGPFFMACKCASSRG